MDTIRRAAQWRFDMIPCFHDKILTFKQDGLYSSGYVRSSLM
jgi:hypothetical protein